jgi:hypothetical protein
LSKQDLQRNQIGATNASVAVDIRTCAGRSIEESADERIRVRGLDDTITIGITRDGPRKGASTAQEKDGEQGVTC